MRSYPFRQADEAVIRKVYPAKGVKGVTCIKHGSRQKKPKQKLLPINRPMCLDK